MSYILLLAGFVLLIKGADLFVSGSSDIAKSFGIPSVVIGLTVVALGTSAPEAAVSITAALRGDNGIAVGNVLGSNIFNMLMVVGVAALFRPCPVDRGILRRDFPFLLGVTALLLALGMDSLLMGREENLLSRLDGLILLLLMAFFIFYTVRGAVRSAQRNLEEDSCAPSMGKAALLSLIGLAAIVAGGKLVVDSATEIALSFGVSQTLIGLTVVAIGTSLPELVTSAVAARKGESGIAIGNAVGSSIFNILFVLALSCFIHPIPFSALSLYDTAAAIGTSLLVYLFCRTKGRVDRWEGALCIFVYFSYTAYILLR